MFYSFYSDSPVGQLLMTSDGQNLTGLQMNKQRYNHITENWQYFYRPNNGLTIIVRAKSRALPDWHLNRKVVNFSKKYGGFCRPFLMANI